jgi:Major tropism determinant N-terminal domain
MAVIQISKIQVRRGAIGDQALPQLASGEFGWAVDTQQLFIGNGSVAEGSPAVGNTEILTERSIYDVLANFTSTVVTYRGHNSNVALQTGPIVEEPTQRLLQNILDDSVSVLSFGASENNIDSNSTEIFQRAVNQVVLREKIKKPIRIPAGTYYCTGTISLPADTNLVGDGIGRTIIYAMGTGDQSTVFKTTASNIRLSGMTLIYSTATAITQTKPLVITQNADGVTLSDIRFTGGYTKLTATTTASYAAVLLDGVQPINPSSGYSTKIVNCQMDALCYPVVSNADVTDVVIRDNYFHTLYQGITFAANLTGSGYKVYGPSRVSIKDNKFEYIKRQGIVASYNTATNNMINSENNTFVDVGNDMNGDASSTQTSIITFNSFGNSSINDNFARLWSAQTTALGVAQKPVVDGIAGATVKTKYTNTYPVASTSTNQLLFRLPYDGNTISATLEYTIYKLNLVRKGILSVVGGPSDVSIKDDYTLAGNAELDDVIFSAALADVNGNLANDTLAINLLNPTTNISLTFNISYYTTYVA